MSIRGETRRSRAFGTMLAVGATGALIAAGCSRPGGGIRTTTTRYQPTTTMDHGGEGCMPGMVMPGCPDDGGGGPMDHAHGGGASGSGHHIGYDHEPTQAQKEAAWDLIVKTRRAVGNISVATLMARGYFTIGDAATGTNHYVNRPYHYDQYNLDPNHVEAFAVRGGRVVAAMYILSNGMTAKDVPDIAGNWTQWHDHTLPFRSNNPTVNGYYQLGGAYMRQTAPMLHVWLVPNSDGPFAGTDNMNMTGAKHPEAEPPAGWQPRS
jgi:hypothetical protein